MCVKHFGQNSGPVRQTTVDQRDQVVQSIVQTAAIEVRGMPAPSPDGAELHLGERVHCDALLEVAAVLQGNGTTPHKPGNPPKDQTRALSMLTKRGELFWGHCTLLQLVNISP